MYYSIDLQKILRPLQNLEHISNILPEFSGTLQKFRGLDVAIAVNPDLDAPQPYTFRTPIYLSIYLRKILDPLQNLEHISNILPEFSATLQKFLP